MSGLVARLKNDSGVSLVEMLVMLFIFSMLTSLVFAMVLNSSSNVRTVRQATDLNEESRLVMNRISRELREATSITAVVNPDASNSDGTARVCGVDPAPCFNPNADVGVTFEVDFDRDGTIEPSAADPERLTYLYDRANQKLLLQSATGPCAAPGCPVLAANVTSFQLTYRSSNYKCDSNFDGVVTWREVETTSSPCPDAAGTLVGGVSALDTELTSVDQIIIGLSVLNPPRTQEYRTKIDLRNRQ